MQPNVSTLWDIKNVTPSIDAFFTDALLELAGKEGNLSSATAIDNWRKNHGKYYTEFVVAIILTPSLTLNSSSNSWTSLKTKHHG